MDNQTGLNAFFTLVIGTLTMGILVSAVIVFAFLYQRKLRRKEMENRHIEKLLKKEELKSAYSLIEGQEQERKRIAEDLHDNVGSLLSSLRMYAETLQKLGVSPAHESLTVKISQVAEQAAEETRRISHNLDSGSLKHFGLRTALLQLCEAIHTSGKIIIKTSLDFDYPLKNDLSLNVYRIVQELFSNTLKHAQASQIHLEVTIIPREYLSLIFEDNGKGFDSSDIALRGIGLFNLQSRVDRFNGQITIDSKKDKGTTIIIEIPLPDAE